MAKRRISDQEFEQQFVEAVRRGKEKAKTQPQAKSVSYDHDSNRLVVEFKNGAMFAVPCDLIPELSGANPNDIADVMLLPRGAALHWEKLNQDFSIARLMASVFGNDIWLAELGRKGGTVSSEAKAAAARANGQKGGRPAKVRVIEDGLFEAHLIEEMDSPFVHAVPTMGRCSHIATAELGRLEAELSRHQQEALKNLNPLDSLEVQFALSNNLTIERAFILEQKEYGALRFDCLKAGKEAANNAELALGA